MKEEMNIIIRESDYHRNGISGQGFTVSLFDATVDGKRRRMVAIDFGQAVDKMVGAVTCAVLDVDMTAAGEIAFARGNSWRGDHFHEEVRKQVKARAS